MIVEQGLWPEDTLLDEGSYGDYIQFKSLRTGKEYRIARSVKHRIEEIGEEEKLKITELILRKSVTEEQPYIMVNTPFLDEAKNVSVPSVEERLERGLRVITEYCPKIGTRVDLRNSVEIKYILYGALFSCSFSELSAFLSSYSERGMIEVVKLQENIELAVFSTKINAYLSLKEINSSQVFVAMWFNEEVNSIYDEAIEPAIRECGYIPRRIDRADFNGKIDDEIIAEIRKSKFVIADFTSKSNEPRVGVYYEAGFAQGLGLQVIWTARNDMFEYLHFDTRQYNHIGWENAEDLKPKLLHRILATIGAGPHVIESE